MIENEPSAPAQAHPEIGSPGAVVVAGLATAVVIAMWFVFYFLVFVPRAPVP